MRGFISKILMMFACVIAAIALSLLYIPDKVSENSILGAIKDKHQLLEKSGSGKIILVGGSNVSFGADSKRLSDSLGKKVVNTGLHGGLGLKFILNDIKPYVREGDVVVVMPEYEYFYTDNLYGEMELVSVVFDVEPAAKSLLDAGQWLHLLKYLPTYSARKIKNYLASLVKESGDAPNIYHRNSFNQYGDASLHWHLPAQNYLPAPALKGKEHIYPEAIQCLKNFKEYLNCKNARLLLLPPVMDSTSFTRQQIIITKIANELRNNDLAFEAEPAKYKYSDCLFFNSYYHLNKKGVDIRTIELLREISE
jgi:hypothetical protein